MRDLAECQAEVFRRSEQRIKQRRKHILVSCVPLVLCASLLAAAAFHIPGPTKSTVPDAVQSPMGAVTAGGIPECKVAKISVSGSGLALSFTEPGQILPILELLDSCTGTALENNSPADGQTRGESFDCIEDSIHIKSEASRSDSANAGFTVTLTPREGGEREYFLAGNTLEDRTNGTVYTLPQDLANELYTLLGISHP